MYTKFNIYTENHDDCPYCAEILTEAKADITPEESEKVNEIIKATQRLKLNLLSVASDPKTLKSLYDKRTGDRYLTGILYIAPAKEGGVNVCVGSTGCCRIGCLNTAGNAAFLDSKIKSRIRKAKELHLTPESFYLKLQSDIILLKDLANQLGLKLAIRLNGTSDVDFGENLEAFINQHSDIKFYDYTKIVPRYKKYKQSGLIHQTFSRSELNDKAAEQILKDGGNVAYVFYQKNNILPAYYKGYKVINGDESDLRFLDDVHKELDKEGKPKGIIVGLNSKGVLKGRGSRARAIRRSKMWNKKQKNPNYIDSPEFKKDAADYFGVASLDELLNDPDKLKEYQNFRNPDGRLLEPDGGFEIIVDDLKKIKPSIFDAPEGVKPDGTPILDTSVEAQAGAESVEDVKESRYVNRFGNLIKSVMEGAYVHTKPSIDPNLDQEGASKRLAEHVGSLKQNPSDYQALKDAFNIIQTFSGDDFVINNKTVSKVDVLKYLLNITKTDEHDYTKLKTHTIDEFKDEGGLESFYHLYKNMISAIGELSKPRSRREDAAGNFPIYYIGTDGEPYVSKIYVPENGIVSKPIFWKGNRMAGKLKPGPIGFGHEPKELLGKTLQEIRDAVEHDKAKAAFQKKYPPNDPKFAAFYKKLR